MLFDLSQHARTLMHIPNTCILYSKLSMSMVRFYLTGNFCRISFFAESSFTEGAAVATAMKKATSSISFREQVMIPRSM